MKNIVDLVYDKLGFLKTYRPVKNTNKIMSEVYDMILRESVHTNAFQSNKVKQKKIWDIMYRTEYEMEKHIAAKIINSQNPWSVRNDFIYCDNYYELVKKEWEVLKLVIDYIYSPILFVGGGAVPFTAIILAQIYGVTSIVIDSDAEAVSLAERVIDALGLAHMIKVRLGNVIDYPFDKIEKYSVLYVASMVFHSTEQDDVFGHVVKNISADIPLILRSTSGVRELFYCPIDCYKLFNSVQVVGMFNPIGGENLINSFYLCYVKKHDYLR